MSSLPNDPLTILRIWDALHCPPAPRLHSHHRRYSQPSCRPWGNSPLPTRRICIHQPCHPFNMENQKEAHQNYLRCNQVAISKKKWALPADIRAALTQLFVGNPDRIFVLFFDHLYKNMDATLPMTLRSTVQELGYHGTP